MIGRTLSPLVFSSEWGRQMRMILGPRQVGKTTLAKDQLRREKSEHLYYLWDLRTVRHRYREQELFFTADDPGGKRIPWVCFDEIHKMPRWKNILKGIYDETSDRYRFIVTGSARLNLVRRAGDSLAGRYAAFHLSPLTLAEVTGSPLAGLDEWLEMIRDRRPAPSDAFEQLLRFGGFPEPFLKSSQTFHGRWENDYADAVVREDIGSLTRIVERENVVGVLDLLPGAVGSPISYSSLGSHLQISPITAKDYLRRLQDFYCAYSLHPYSRNIKRAILKAPKFYLTDWSRIPDPAKRFENYVASELSARTRYWTYVTGIAHSLWFVRTKESRESDFLVCRREKPVLLVESKVSDTGIESHHLATAGVLGKIPVIQVCARQGILSMETRNAFRVSADRLFAS
jgi:predicted AAA+ superfamily ATPase